MILCGIVITLIIIWVIAKLIVVSNRGNACLVGKTVIVTGANSGIGYECALEFAARGARVVMAVRNLETSEVARKKIIEETDNENIVIIKLDLLDNESVRAFAKEFKALPNPRLDLLVNNAGITMSQGKKNKEGLDITLQGNYLGHFLLTHCLADVMKATKNTRIVNVSSSLAFLENLSYENMAEDNGTFQYGNTKLMQIICSTYFSEKLGEFGVTSNSVNPGFTRTNIHNVIRDKAGDFAMWGNIIMQYLIGHSAREGANTVLDAALNNKWKNKTDLYFWYCMSMFKPRKCNNKKFCADIIKKSKQLVNLKQSEEI